MKDDPKMSMTIVVPVFNRPVLARRCLDSIKSQTWRPLRLIVVDNGSTDNTLDVLRLWSEENQSDDFSVEVLEDIRKGAAYARQTGLDHTVTDRVMFFDSDDAMHPDSVESIMERWKADKDAEIVAFPVARLRQGKIDITHSISGNLLERHLVHAILQTQGYAIKTDYLRNVGGWKGQFPNWNDFETGVRILLPSPKVLSIDRPLADVYPQTDSITGTSFSAKAGKWEISLSGVENSIRQSGHLDIPRLLNIVSYRRAILAADYAKERRSDLAKPLYHQALREVPAKKRPLIRFAYHWTRLGMRGAFSVVGHLL